MCGQNTPLWTEGIFIKGKFICARCEQMILAVHVDDIWYPFIKDQLKHIWFNRTEGPYFS
ncbi:sigma factor G inhibitor Gin [Candidatus Formimonas warabiya]